MPKASEVYERTYNSFSGVDIKAIFHNKAVMPLQAISYAIQREKAPIYTMGNPNPRAYSRGKRGIAGTLIFALFDKHALTDRADGIFKDAKFYADREEVKPSFQTTFFSSDPQLEAGTGVGVGDIYGETDIPEGGALDSDQVYEVPWYADQIPPFNITLTGSNEYGVSMIMRVYGVELLNEGYGISIDDLMSEMQYTYVAKEISPWQRLVRQGKLATAGA